MDPWTHALAVLLTWLVLGLVVADARRQAAAHFDGDGDV